MLYDPLDTVNPCLMYRNRPRHTGEAVAVTFGDCAHGRAASCPTSRDWPLRNDPTDIHGGADGGPPDAHGGTA